MESDREPRSPLATDPAQDATRMGAAATPADDELQGVIDDVEKQLASLRTYRAQHEEARLKWQAVEQELTRRAADVAAQASALDADRRALAQERSAHAAQQAELASKAERIEKDFQSLAEEQRRAAEVAETREADLAHRSTTLEQREQRLAEQAASISRQREQVQTLEADLAQRERALAERAAEIERRTQAIGTLEARVAASEGAAQRAAEELKRATEELDRAREQARTRDASLAERVTEIESLKAELVRSGEAQSELMRSLTDRENSYREIKAALKESVSRTERAREALAASEQSVADFKRQVIERDGRIQELSGKLASATGKLREVSQGIQEHADLVGQARNLEAQLAERAAQVAALEAELNTARAALSQRPESIPDAAVLAERETLRIRCEELEEQVLQEHGRLEKAAAEIGRLRERLESAPAVGAGGFADVPEEVGEAIVSRWRRLRLMRSMLREQADKVRQAGEALRTRYEEVERVATDRQNLARERAAFAAARGSLEAKPIAKVKTSALGASAFAAVAIAALAGLSWAIGGQMAPATYEARATIRAEGREGAPSQDQLGEWQKYHESLLKDPALTELTAERMGRRGIASLATPGALMSRLESDLSTQSPSPGQLTIQLRGRGASETARVLDTYVTALVSQANADRERRTDGLATAIGEGASTGGGPVEDSRLIYAAITFVVGAGLSFGAGTLALGRLSAAKDRLERGHEDDDNPAEWEKPPQDYAR